MAITREEQLLNSMATGVASGIEPITREEQYLAYIAGETYTKPDPITRKEVFLDRVPQGGGGGGVTIKNQNKTITENGTYKADSGYTGLGTVTVNVASSGGGGGENKFADLVGGSLTEVTATDLNGLTKINPYAFSHNSTLASVEFPDTITEIGERAFEYCAELSGDVVLPSGLTTIKDSTFSNCAKINRIFLPSGITSINYYAFSSCKITEVHFANNLEAWLKIEIGSNAQPMSSNCKLFLNGTELTDAVIPTTVTMIGAYQFQNCGSITSVVPQVEAQSISIGDYAFKYCRALKTVKTGNLTSIGSYAFQTCDALESVEFGEDSTLTEIKANAFTGCLKLKGVTIPKSVVTIAGSAFYQCELSNGVNFNDVLKKIDSRAFMYANVTSIELPSTLTSIGNSAFSNCQSLATVTVKAVTPPTLGSSVFQSCYNLAKIAVPIGSGDAYKSATNWSAYADKIVEEAM